MNPLRSGTCLLLAALSLLSWTAAPQAAAQGSDPAFAWGGHLRAIGTAAFPDADDARRSLDRDPYLDGQAELRLKNQLLMGERWTLGTHYELVALGGDSRENDQRLAATTSSAELGLTTGGGVDDAHRLLDLTGILDEGDRHLTYHRLDRFYLGYQGSWGSLRLGRQALTWGDGLVFNPMDLISPFAPTTVQRDYKSGEDMLFLQLPLGAVESEALYLPRRDPDSGELSEDEASYALKLHRPVGALEVDLLGARHYGDAVVAGGASGYLGGSLWRVNLTYTHTGARRGKDGFLQAVANLDYAWVWGGRNLYGLVEYYYNEAGYDGDYGQALRDEELTERLARGEAFTLGRSYLAGRLQVEAHPLVQLHTTAMVNLHDASGLIQPQLLWDLATDWQLIIGGQSHWGRGESEFGGFSVAGRGGAVRLIPEDRLYVWLSRYF